MNDILGLAPEEIAGGLVGLGLVVKGVAHLVASKKSSVARGCLYGDKAHEELKQEFRAMKVQMAATQAEVTHNNRLLIELRAVLRSFGRGQVG